MRADDRDLPHLLFNDQIRRIGPGATGLARLLAGEEARTSGEPLRPGGDARRSTGPVDRDRQPRQSEHTPDEVRDALIEQWRKLAQAVPDLDLTAPTRLPGWTNREVVAHLAAQPALLVRFLAGAAPDAAEMTLEANLHGTKRLAERVDAAARDAAAAGRTDLAAAVHRAVDALLAADLRRTVVTLQGPIGLADYLVTRCIEAAVHGLDLVPPVAPAPAARSVAAHALRRLLARMSPELIGEADRLDDITWLEGATGRRPLEGPLASAVPLMA